MSTEIPKKVFKNGLYHCSFFLGGGGISKELHIVKL